MSVSARNGAVLADGRRVLLLDDRGWNSWLRVSWGSEPSEDERGRRAEQASTWATETVEGMRERPAWWSDRTSR